MVSTGYILNCYPNYLLLPLFLIFKLFKRPPFLLTKQNIFMKTSVPFNLLLDAWKLFAQIFILVGIDLQLLDF